MDSIVPLSEPVEAWYFDLGPPPQGSHTSCALPLTGTPLDMDSVVPSPGEWRRGILMLPPHLPTPIIPHPPEKPPFLCLGQAPHWTWTTWCLSLSPWRCGTLTSATRPPSRIPRRSTWSSHSGCFFYVCVWGRVFVFRQLPVRSDTTTAYLVSHSACGGDWDDGVWMWWGWVG